MAKKNIDISNLEEQLSTLSGLDLEDCMREEIRSGNNVPKADLYSDRSFLIRLAAKAMKIPCNELKALPLKDYYKISDATVIFLTNTLPTQADLIRSDSTEDSASI